MKKLSIRVRLTLWYVAIFALGKLDADESSTNPRAMEMTKASRIN